MMHFSSYFGLSLCFIVLSFCRPTVAAALAVSPAKRGRPFDPIECPGLPPEYIPPYLPLYPTLLDMCASKAGHPKNLECTCYGNELVCGSSRWSTVKVLIRHCLAHCNCGDDTKINRKESTKKLEYEPTTFAGSQNMGSGGFTGSRASNPHRAPSGNNPTWSIPARHTCSKTCTSVSRGCPWGHTGDCTCYAPPAGLLFWHSGNCGPVHPLPKRDLAQQRHSYYLNATSRYAPPNSATAPLGPSPKLHAQLTSGMLPSPCNASYVSFACPDSPDGIVHERPQNWRGALLPEDATEFPPVPKEFLRIHKL